MEKKQKRKLSQINAFSLTQFPDHCTLVEIKRPPEMGAAQERGVLESVFTGIAIKRNAGENLVSTVSNETLLQTLSLWIIIIIYYYFTVLHFLNLKFLFFGGSDFKYIYI